MEALDPTLRFELVQAAEYCVVGLVRSKRCLRIICLLTRRRDLGPEQLRFDGHLLNLRQTFLEEELNPSSPRPCLHFQQAAS